MAALLHTVDARRAVAIEHHRQFQIRRDVPVDLKRFEHRGCDSCVCRGCDVQSYSINSATRARRCVTRGDTSRSKVNTNVKQPFASMRPLGQAPQSTRATALLEPTKLSHALWKQSGSSLNKCGRGLKTVECVLLLVFRTQYVVCSMLRSATTDVRFQIR